MKVDREKAPMDDPDWKTLAAHGFCSLRVGRHFMLVPARIYVPEESNIALNIAGRLA